MSQDRAPMSSGAQKGVGRPVSISASPNTSWGLACLLCKAQPIRDLTLGMFLGKLYHDPQADNAGGLLRDLERSRTLLIFLDLLVQNRVRETDIISC